jgi:murein DD-endopeptidase MepM/ murein hydrolase activator NlpD
MALGCGDGPRSQPVETATPDPQHEVATTERELVAQVVDEAGRGIPQVRVAIAGTTITGETDAEGTITLRVPITGEHTLALDGPHVHPAEVVWQPDGASRIELARRAGLLARVVIDGAPIAGAEVHVSDGSRPTLATAITGDDGVVRFDALRPGPHELWARHGDRVSPLARIADARDAQIELALAAGDEIRGAVSSDAGLPRTARVTLVPIDVDHALRTATLDDAGRFSIAGVPRGKWRVVAEAPGHVQQHDAVVDSRTGQVTVRLARSGTVAGRVVDGDGEPVANATIVLRAQGRATRSLGIESIRPLRWVHPLAGRRLLPTREFVRFGAPRKGHRPVECGAGHCGVDLGWQRGTIVHAAADGTIARAVTENRGEAGRAIAIDHAGGMRTYYLHLDELRAGIEVGQVVRAGEPIGTVGTTGSTRGPHLHFALTEQRGSRAWYVDPEPMLQHAVVLPTPGSMDPLMRDATAVMVARALDRDVAELEPRAVTTDAQGRFRIAGVPPGSYVAVAVATELAPGTSAGFTVRGGAELADIAIALRPGTIVEGRVAGRDGPISGATIIATSGSGETAQEIASGRTSATGEFTLRALSGTITLAITAPGHGTVERTLALGQGRRHREDFLLATENARLFGQVLAADGVPAEQVTVRVLEGPTRRRATADASARARRSILRDPARAGRQRAVRSARRPLRCTARRDPDRGRGTEWAHRECRHRRARRRGAARARRRRVERACAHDRLRAGAAGRHDPPEPDPRRRPARSRAWRHARGRGARSTRSPGRRVARDDRQRIDAQRRRRQLPVHRRRARRPPARRRTRGRARHARPPARRGRRAPVADRRARPLIGSLTACAC